MKIFKFTFLLNCFFFQSQVELYAAFLHDAAMLYAHALNKTLNKNGTIQDGHLIIQNMFNYSFEGESNFSF